MKVSIITITYNSENTLRTCIESVLNQTYKNIEHIIVDGKSTDGTLNIVNEYREGIANIISEPDDGIYDAMNKGIKLATGDIVGILNSDDFYIDSYVIEKIVNSFIKYKVDSLYGDLLYVDPVDTNKVIRYWKSSVFIPGSFKRGWHPPHPTFFVKKLVYDKYGGFDLNFEVSADFELMLRFLEKYKISTYYLNEPLVKMRMGGVSNNSVFNVIKGNINCYKAFKKNGLDVSILYLFYRLLPKVKQFFGKRSL